jgi:hypothetical protein
VPVSREHVPKETIARSGTRRGREEQWLPGLERTTLHEIDVEIAVVVVVEQRAAGAHDLGM